MNCSHCCFFPLLLVGCILLWGWVFSWEGGTKFVLLHNYEEWNKWMGPYSIADVHLGSSSYISNWCNQPLLKLTRILFTICYEILTPTMWTLLSHLWGGVCNPGEFGWQISGICIRAAGTLSPGEPGLEQVSVRWSVNMRLTQCLLLFLKFPNLGVGGVKLYPKARKPHCQSSQYLYPFLLLVSVHARPDCDGAQFSSGWETQKVLLKFNAHIRA